MPGYEFTLVVEGDELTEEQALRVITERIEFDEDYGFPYHIQVMKTHAPKQRSKLEMYKLMVLASSGDPKAKAELRKEGEIIPSDGKKADQDDLKAYEREERLRKAVKDLRESAGKQGIKGGKDTNK